MAKNYRFFDRKNFLVFLKTGLVALWPGAALLLVYQILIKTGLYSQYPLLDNPLHLLGAAGLAWAAFIFIRFFQSLKLMPKLSFWLLVLLAVGVAAIIGILWEQYEFLLDLSRGGWQPPPIADTLKDLTNDLLGSFVFAYLFGRRFAAKSR